MVCGSRAFSSGANTPSPIGETPFLLHSFNRPGNGYAPMGGFWRVEKPLLEPQIPRGNLNEGGCGFLE